MKSFYNATKLSFINNTFTQKLWISGVIFYEISILSFLVANLKYILRFAIPCILETPSNTDPFQMSLLVLGDSNVERSWLNVRNNRDLLRGATFVPVKRFDQIVVGFSSLLPSVSTIYRSCVYWGWKFVTNVFWIIVYLFLGGHDCDIVFMCIEVVYI